ncbi:Daunorubicin/doxorubicin resistance ATP-binding protein DrrA [compost metagenome]|jgi:ABC-2 type transport system ATP-binding protein|uniref:ATP-binding cassette domain-containing protein n=1 Tax=Pseudomonas germanica TaxID=2815720 RepID=A0ABX8YI92_9PSED|nr:MULTISPECIES: ATP-binding cassette domain-containing protein [Pseudomonas]QYY79297.1 ATP-binding cassette domain-containing protein [Pseudomonas germanica]UVL32212.1 ATP-binding cassette domain-containing protein [Pseudomonas sp. B21-041]WPN72092.1 ATP-binding cassette domain-containing protein [Pseudomonas germanica]
MSKAIELCGISKVYEVYRARDDQSRSLLRYFRREKTYVPAVTDVSFSIDAGEVVGFLGGNGAGKTTTLKMLSGIVRPSGGHLSVLGHDPFKRRAEFLKSIALVMGQKQQLTWDLPALESFHLHGALYDIAPVECRRRIDELCQLLSAGDIIRRPVRKLSLGERMKCELILSLLHRPSILFLDEPTIGLDLEMQVAIRKFLLEYNRESGATIILTSHYMADIEALANRVIVLDQGRVVFDGARQALVKAHVNERQVSLRFSSQVGSDELSVYGTLLSLDSDSAELLVPEEQFADTVGQLLANFPVTDISIQTPSLEQAFPRLLLPKEHA